MPYIEFIMREHETKSTFDAKLNQTQDLERTMNGSSVRVISLSLNNSTARQPAYTSDSLVQLQRQYGNRYIQRAVDLMRKEGDKDEVAPEVEAAINRKRGTGHALDSDVRAQMETTFGADFRHVRVHTDTEADTLNRELNAHAFTTGKDIFFRKGKYHPDNSDGGKLLAHELTHVVQQEKAHVLQKLRVSEPSDISEREAEQVSQEMRTEQREKMVKGFRSIHRTQVNLQRRTVRVPYPWEKPPLDFTLIITGDFKTTSSDFYQFKQACWSGIKMAFKSVEYIKARDHLNEIRGQRKRTIELKYRSPSGEFLEIKKEAEGKAKAFFASVIPLKGKREGASEKAPVVPGEAVPAPKHETGHENVSAQEPKPEKKRQLLTRKGIVKLPNLRPLLKDERLRLLNLLFLHTGGRLMDLMSLPLAFLTAKHYKKVIALGVSLSGICGLRGSGGIGVYFGPNGEIGEYFGGGLGAGFALGISGSRQLIVMEDLQKFGGACMLAGGSANIGPTPVTGGADLILSPDGKHFWGLSGSLGVGIGNLAETHVEWQVTFLSEHVTITPEKVKEWRAKPIPLELRPPSNLPIPSNL